MKEDDVRNRGAEQLNKPSVQPEQTSFSLDDIMREFGGWSRREEEKTEAEPVVEAQVVEPEEVPVPEKQPVPSGMPELVLEEEAENAVASEPEPVSEPEPKRPSRFQFIRMDLGEKKEETTDPLELAWERLSAADKETEQPVRVSPVQRAEEPAVELKVLPRPEKRRMGREVQQTSSAEHISNRDAFQKTKKQLHGTTVFMLISVLPLLCSVFVTFWLHFDWALPMGKPKASVVSVLMLAMLILSALLSFSELMDGIRALRNRRFTLQTSLVFIVAAALLDGLTVLSGSRLPLAAPVCLTLFLALFGRWLRFRAVLNSLRVVLDAKEPQAIAGREDFWHGNDCLIRQTACLDGAADAILERDGCSKALEIYAPVSVLICVILAAVIASLTNTSYFQVVAVLLIGAMPAGGFVAYALPWNLVSSRLKKVGAALLGWSGAKTVCGQKHLVLRGNDLFPTANVSFNGLKVCGDYRMSQVVSYAGTVIVASDCELVPLFQNLMNEYGAHTYLIGSFRRYEGGGYGAEIAGDVVLTGSQRFMQLMGIKIPAELSGIKQALYLSINGSLAGVFALNYKASASVRTSLALLQRSKSLTLLLSSRDVLISPQMVSKRYHISSDFIEFPAVADRFALSEPEHDGNGTLTAVLSRNSFSSYSGAVLFGRSLAGVTRWATALSVISGVLGLALMLLLTRVGAANTASAANLVQYMFLWLVPVFLLGFWVRK
ncbi:MAG: hypothetical protein E7449_05675 [Ruminococcaceae bacterium]|nr:hypothetical protein [Oscillospiraceae bacterium]